MGARDVLARVLRPLVKAAEGQYRPGPYAMPVSGGFLSAEAGSYQNWWQMGYDIEGGSSRCAIVEACVSAYAQTVAMCPGDHWRLDKKGGRERVKNSALSRVLRHPNAYQSVSDFLLNLVRSLYLDGNAYALALRNDRYEVTELHLMNPRSSAPQLASTGDVFYQLGGNDVVARQIEGPLLVPQRDVLHVRLHVDRRYPYPLIGESPLMAAMCDVAAAGAITDQQTQFYANQARPSAVLQTDLVLDKEQVAALRDRWDEQSRGINQGKTPILTAGLKVQPWTVGGREAQIAEVMKFSEQHIALAFRVPLQILGIGGTPYSSTELLMQSWIATGLGFCLNHIEEAFGLLFALKGQPDEYAEFDTSALLRSAHSTRIEALARGVQGGIYAPNEAREMEGLPSVKFGEEPRLQQQVVPLSAAGAIPVPGSAPPGGPPGTGPHPPPAPGPPAPPPASGPAKKPEEPATKEDVQRAMRELFKTAEKINRRYVDG
jgi:HK97 family phage portal protein